MKFNLVHRSLRDPLAADSDAPQMVLQPLERASKKSSGLPAKILPAPPELVSSNVSLVQNILLVSTHIAGSRAKNMIIASIYAKLALR